MKCSFCKVNEARLEPKPGWNVSGKLCQQCYDYKYVHDPKSLVNRPAFRKLLRLSKNRWFITFLAFLFAFSVIMRILAEG